MDPEPGKPLASFGERAGSDRPRGMIAPAGYLDFGTDGLLYHVQWAPQEVRTYTAEGTLVSTFPARSDESAIPEPKIHGDSVTFTLGNTSLHILCPPSGGFLTGLVYRGGDGNPEGVALDLYDTGGRTVGTHRATGVFSPLCLDAASRLYVAQERNDLPVVVRYRLELPEPVR